MPRYFIRSTIFNILFYILTAISCILLLPTLFLPRSSFLFIVYGFVHITTFLEETILGLTFEVRGVENIPKQGSYIVAAKHQSAYETLKLHILFKDPAVVLKKELLKIPLWGRYLKKSDVIAIDRSSPKIAIQSIQEGARHVSAQGRPIIIFPQGTRVSMDTTPTERPYKIGVVRIQEATGLPIIPLALNTGFFYPRHKWCKRPGKVVFEFLPPVMPSDNPSKVLNQLEMAIEEKSSRLTDQAKEQEETKARKRPFAVIVLSLLAFIYTLNWYIVAAYTKGAVNDFFADLDHNTFILETELPEPIISGFPFKMTLNIDQIFIKTKAEEFALESFTAKSWPFYGMNISITTGGITYGQHHWSQILFFDSLTTKINFVSNVLNIEGAALTSGETVGIAGGHIDLNAAPYPAIDLDIALKNYSPFMTDLVSKGIVKQKPAMIATLALQAMQQSNGLIRTTLTSDKNKVYLGPLKIAELPLIDNRYQPGTSGYVIMPDPDQ